jgi:hypothetical protein
MGGICITAHIPDTIKLVEFGHIRRRARDRSGIDFDRLCMSKSIIADSPVFAACGKDAPKF